MDSDPGGLVADLIDLVLPGECPGCRAAGAWRTPGICPDCWRAFSATGVFDARPDPMPAGFPPTLAAAPYGGVMREFLLAYKERGRHPLAVPLAERLAAVAYAGLTALAIRPGTQLALLPVPDTAAAARSRYGDHLRRLAHPVAETLTAAGFPASIPDVLRARPKADATALDSAARRVAAGAFTVRPASVDSRAVVVLLDDIVTTGATLAAISSRLAEAGVHVRFAAVLAATVRRYRPADRANR